MIGLNTKHNDSCLAEDPCGKGPQGHGEPPRKVTAATRHGRRSWNGGYAASSRFARRSKPSLREGGSRKPRPLGRGTFIPGGGHFRKQSRQSTGFPGVGRNGTCVGAPHCVHVASCISRFPLPPRPPPPPPPPLRLWATPAFLASRQ